MSDSQEALAPTLETIVAILSAHRLLRVGTRHMQHGEEVRVATCGCLWEGGDQDDHRRHVASELFRVRAEGAVPERVALRIAKEIVADYWDCIENAGPRAQQLVKDFRAAVISSYESVSGVQKGEG